MSDDLLEFARILVQAVRDEAVRNCDNYLLPGDHTPVGRRWAHPTDGACKEAIRRAIPDIVDETLFYLINRGIDQGMLQLTFHASSGRTLDLTEAGDGELGGWFMTAWRQEYSQERFSDDFGASARALE
ncbi:MAG TPA: hypothetical protein VF062_11850 [Candidatus Limnocylindrales bacterium]